MVPSKIALKLSLRRPAAPIKPEASSKMAPGRGTGEGVMVILKNDNCSAALSVYSYAFLNEREKAETSRISRINPENRNHNLTPSNPMSYWGIKKAAKTTKTIQINRTIFAVLRDNILLSIVSIVPIL